MSDFSEKAVKISDIAVNFFLLAIIFLAPLFFNPLTYISFEIDKIVLFRVLLELALFFYLLKCLLTKKIDLPRSNIFFLAVALIFLTQLLSFVFSGHSYTAFWGSYWRGLGLFTYLHLYLFTFLIYVQPLSRKKIFITATSSAFLASLYGLIQVSGFDPLKWQDNTSGIFGRAASTLGQPNFLAAFLLLTLPLGGYLLGAFKKPLSKLIIITALLAELLCFLATYSRAAWIGLGVSILIFGIIFLYKLRKKIKATGFLLMVFAAGVILGGLLIVKSQNANKDELTFLGRIAAVADFKKGSAGLRLYYYQAALEIIKERPWTGFGPDTQAYYFARHYAPDYAILEKINMIPDRTHNEPLDILLTTGILGLGAWTFLFLALAWNLADKRKEISIKKKGREAAFLLFGLVALAIYLLFSFFTIVDAIYFWLYLALLFKLIDVRSAVFELKLRKSIAWLSGLTLFSTLVFVVCQYNYKFTLADYYERQARQAVIRGDFGKSFANYSASIRLFPEENFYPSQMAAQLVSPFDGIRDQRERKAALEELKKNLDRISYGNLSFEGQVFRAIVLGKLGEYSGADKAFTQITLDYPGFARPYLDWGNLYLDQKLYKQALEKYFRGLSLYPDLSDPNLNSEHREDIVLEMVMAYKQIVFAELNLKNPVLAKKYNDLGLKLSPFDFELHLQHNEILFALGQKKELLSSLAHDLMLFPQSDKILKEQKAFNNR